MSARRNPWELLRRREKVIALLAVIPYGRTSAEVDEIAALVAALGREGRELVARQAGVKHPPSDETWAMVVAEVKGRRTPGQIHRQLVRERGVA